MKLGHLLGCDKATSTPNGWSASSWTVRRHAELPTPTYLVNTCGFIDAASRSRSTRCYQRKP